MELFPAEPAFGPWRVEAIRPVLDRVRPGPGTRVVAVDGGSAGGKTTCAAGVPELPYDPATELVVSDPRMGR